MTEKKTKAGKTATTWAKGQSGNPGGRSPRVGPNGETVAELARTHTKEAIDALVRVVKNDSHPQQVNAANALLDRGWGKPKESMDLDARVEGTGVPVIQIVRVSSDGNEEG